MTVQYVAHPDLRLAFIQVIAEPGMVYVVSDEPLPVSCVDAVEFVQRWRVENAYDGT